MKRSLDKRHTQTYGTLIETFQQSQMSFLIRRINVCEHMVKMGPRECVGKVPPEGCRTGRGRSGGD